jgi:hypothetical protein
VLGAERYNAVHIMKYKPPLVSAIPRKKFGAPGYSATLLGDIRTAGVTQYAYLLLVYGPSPNEPVLIVSSEFFAGGPDTVLGVFDDHGHETLYNEAGGWKDESKFAAKAVVIANERLKTDLREQMRHSDMTMFTCSTCGKEWPENYCPECARTIERPLTQPTPPGAPPVLARTTRSESETKLSPGQSATRVGRNDCPICGSANTGKADGKFKTLGFQAFPNRYCYACDAAWQPTCPKWAALPCVVSGCALWMLDLFMSSGLFRHGLIGFLSWIPILYGLAVLFGIGGKLRILSKGSLATEQVPRIRSK